MTATDRAREALEGITPGAWSVCDDHPDFIEVIAPYDHDRKLMIYVRHRGFSDKRVAQIVADARFIAAAPQLIRDLLADNEAMRSLLALYEGTTGQPISNTGLINDLAGTVQALATQVRAAADLEKEQADD